MNPTITPEAVALVSTLTAKRGAITALSHAPLTWHTVENARKALDSTIHAAMLLIEALPSQAQDTPDTALTPGERWFLRQARESEGGPWLIDGQGAVHADYARRLMQRGYGLTMVQGEGPAFQFWLNPEGMAALDAVAGGKSEAAQCQA